IIKYYLAALDISAASGLFVGYFYSLGGDYYLPPRSRQANESNLLIKQVTSRVSASVSPRSTPVLFIPFSQKINPPPLLSVTGLCRILASVRSCWFPVDQLSAKSQYLPDASNTNQVHLAAVNNDNGYGV
ncbi:hypothetical protein T310_0131, partial [Rasamsonia emersonii CBS 393.64]